MKTKKINVSRGTFNIREGGDKKGFPVIMFHGWPESSYCWEAVASHLDPALHHIAPDLRGLGDSERTMDVNAYQKVELAKDMVEVINALDINEFFLVGHDWGGVVAQEVALLIPERVKRLVLMNISIINNVTGNLEALKKIYKYGGLAFWYQYFQIQPGLPEAMIKGNEKVWVSHFFGKAGKDGTIDSKSIGEYIRCYSIKNTPATAASYYRVRKLDNQHWAELVGQKFPMPSLYIHGSDDLVIIPDFFNHIEDCFDSIHVESLKAGHFVQEEKPKEVAALMNDFFKQT